MATANHTSTHDNAAQGNKWRALEHQISCLQSVAGLLRDSVSDAPDENSHGAACLIVNQLQEIGARLLELEAGAA